jgi:choline monooxygenase
MKVAHDAELREATLANYVATWTGDDVARAETLPASLYVDPNYFDLETKHIFRRTWQRVGRTEQVNNPGDFLVSTVAGEEVVVVRGTDGVLRAFSNICRHRAGPVAIGCGNRKALQCAYHGWTYELDGQLRKAPGTEQNEAFDPTTIRLPEFPVDVWGPLVYVSLDPGIHPLSEWIGGLIARATNYRVDELEYVGGKTWVIPCNWKTYVDNGLEGYHLPFVHPSYHKVVRLDSSYEYSMGDHWNAMYGREPNPRGPASRAADLLSAAAINPVRKFRELAPPMPSLEGPERDGYYYFWFFPNTLIDFMPDGIKVNTVTPLDVGHTQSTMEWWFPPSDEIDKKVLQAAVVAFGHKINDEDAWISTEVQKGLESRFYDRGRYVAGEEMIVHHYHQVLITHLQAELARENGSAH